MKNTKFIKGLAALATATVILLSPAASAAPVHAPVTATVPVPDINSMINEFNRFIESIGGSSSGIPSVPSVPGTPAPNPGANNAGFGYNHSAEILREVNAYRVSKGLAPLKSDPTIVRDADTWSKTMASQDRIYHSNYGLTENVAAFSGKKNNVAAFVVNDWRNSPDHNRIMLKPNMRNAGAACAQSASGKTYCTLMLAG